MKSVDGESIVYQPKPFNPGIIIGGTIFDIGWTVTGTCSSPIYVQIGAGEWPALLTFIGAMGGMYLYGYLRPKLPH
ncbi:MAG: YeeE/YedE thiosulfate transporter family protein [Chloroflexota bacterium]